VRFYFFLPILVLLAGCYEPKSGCLDLEATNYDVSADDQCPDCCKFPTLSLQVQHLVSLPTLPDSLFSMKYATGYQSAYDTNDLFLIDRGRFFISDLKLVRPTGEEVGVLDSVWLPTNNGDSILVENNFSKHDRDIFQAATLGTVRTVGLFSGVKFTLGVSQKVLDEVQIDSVSTGNALAVKSDTLSYDSITGIIPNRLIVSRIIMGDTIANDFRFYEPREISLDFSQPVSIERGFNVKLVLGLNYSFLFQDIDFGNDTSDVIRAKIDSQLTNAFYIVSLKLE
jgi:hypothetical protein